MKRKKVCITGANGFVGSNLTKTLIKMDYDVTCMVRKTSNLESIKNLPVKFAYIDYDSVSSIRQACLGADFVFHIAAKVKEISKEKYFIANVDLTKRIIRAVNDLPLKKFIFLSSQAAEGPADSKSNKTEAESCNPISYYGKSKLAAEKIIQKYAKIPWTIIRPVSVFGPNDTDFFNYFKFVEKHIAPYPGLHAKCISLIFIEDLVELLIAAAESSEASKQIFNAGDGQIYSLDDFIDSVKNAVGKFALTIHIPFLLIRLIAFLNEFKKCFSKTQATLNLQKVREMKEQYWLCSIEKAKTTLRFEPKYSLDQAVKKTYLWYKENKWL
ncbi:MAG: NAD(P)-dependent oxidoreductase [Candidatus Cloacimonadota bacterium]|nr:NAD(P)-dependent oxidoreductase [Candidatus Cloacimonadota bacterium]